MIWEQNKLLFNYILSQDYFIKKDSDTNDILYIKWNQFEMKCKYFLVFSIDNLDNIIWACDNQFIDQKTKFLSQIIKSIYNSNISNNPNKFDSKFLNKIKEIIQTNQFVKFNDQIINFMWGIIGTHSNFKQFYIIIEIIYI